MGGDKKVMEVGVCWAQCEVSWVDSKRQMRQRGGQQQWKNRVRKREGREKVPQGAAAAKAVAREQGAPLLDLGFKFNLLCKESDAKVKQNPPKIRNIKTKRPFLSPFPLTRLPNECQWNANSWRWEWGGLLLLHCKGVCFSRPSPAEQSNRLGCSSHYQFE